MPGASSLVPSRSAAAAAAPRPRTALGVSLVPEIGWTVDGRRRGCPARSAGPQQRSGAITMPDMAAASLLCSGALEHEHAACACSTQQAVSRQHACCERSGPARLPWPWRMPAWSLHHGIRRRCKLRAWFARLGDVVPDQHMERTHAPWNPDTDWNMHRAQGWHTESRCESFT